ncbi:MAG: hypothetical protein GXP49_15600 [Deltaproteobacteria bacterium]|nr:hypothetical protein [Deltaproteobacteria bacterium]
MGLKNLFKGLGSSSPVDRLVKKLTQKYGPTENRMAAAHRLAEIGTPEAIFGLLKRYTILSENGVIDEEEKQQVGHLVLSFGEDAIEPIKESLRKIDQISWPLALLRQILEKDEERFVHEVVSLLNDLDVEYTRNPEKKVALLTFLSGLDELSEDGEYEEDKEDLLIHSSKPPVDHRIAEAALKFLEDEDEEVRFLAVAALGRQKDDCAREPIINLLLEEHTSRRFRVGIAEVLARNEWDVKGFRKQVEEVLPKGFKLDRHGRVRDRRG